jgi:hypothetical protein
VTQVFNHLIEFYQENKPRLEQYERSIDKIEQLELTVSRLGQDSKNYINSIQFNDALELINLKFTQFRDEVKEFRNEVKSDIDGLYSRQHELDIAGIKKSIQQQQIDEAKKLRRK